MNGKASRRIRRAAVAVALSAHGGEHRRIPAIYRKARKSLKAEYRRCPYHRRPRASLPAGVRSLSHREQERWYFFIVGRAGTDPRAEDKHQPPPPETARKAASQAEVSARMALLIQNREWGKIQALVRGDA